MAQDTLFLGQIFTLNPNLNSKFRILFRKTVKTVETVVFQSPTFQLFFENMVVATLKNVKIPLFLVNLYAEFKSKLTIYSQATENHKTKPVKCMFLQNIFRNFFKLFEIT